MWCQYISVIVLNNKFYGKCFKKACAVQFWRPFHKSRRDVRQLLTQSDSLPLDNCSLFNVLCDIAEDTSPLNLGTSCRWSRKKSGTKSFMRNSGEFVQCSSAYWFSFVSGVYTHDDSPQWSIFVTEMHSFADLVSGFSSQCTCGARASWILAGCVQVEWSPWNCKKCACLLQLYMEKGHVLRGILQCSWCNKQKHTWSSSRFFGGQYLANQKYVHLSLF